MSSQEKHPGWVKRRTRELGMGSDKGHGFSGFHHTPRPSDRTVAADGCILSHARHQDSGIRSATFIFAVFSSMAETEQYFSLKADGIFHRFVRDFAAYTVFQLDFRVHGGITLGALALGADFEAGEGSRFFLQNPDHIRCGAAAQRDQHKFHGRVRGLLARSIHDDAHGAMWLRLRSARYRSRLLWRISHALSPVVGAGLGMNQDAEQFRRVLLETDFEVGLDVVHAGQASWCPTSVQWQER